MKDLRERCRLTDFRCYAPSLVCMLVMAFLIAYGTFVMQGREIEAVRPRHIINGFLLWLVMTPVVIGVIRGWRRSRRHMSRPTPDHSSAAGTT